MKDRIAYFLIKSLIFYRCILARFNKRTPIIAIGDSWYNLTIFNLFKIDMLDALREDFNIIDAAIPGYTVQKESKYLLWKFATDHIKKKKEQLYIISLGGNDYVWRKSKEFFYPGTEDVNVEQIEKMTKELVSEIEQLTESILAQNPVAKILIHGYDYAYPGWERWWFKGSLYHQNGKSDKAIDTAMRILVVYHNAELETRFLDNPSVKYVNLTGSLISNDDYLEDMHPSWKAAKRMAAKLKKAITSLDTAYWK